NAALALDVVRVHHPLGDVLVRGKGARLLQQLVDQGGFAVVDVGDDGDIAKSAGHVAWTVEKTAYSTTKLRLISSKIKTLRVTAAQQCCFGAKPFPVRNSEP